MRDNTKTLEDHYGQKGLGKLGRILYFSVFLISVLLLYKEFFDSGYPNGIIWWSLGTICLVLGSLVYVLFLLPAGFRGSGLFVFHNLFLTAFLAPTIQDQWVSNDGFVDLVRSNDLSNLLLGGYVQSVVGSLMLGITVALIITSLGFVAVSFAAAVYILGLHEIDGVSHWDATRYVLALILGINQPFILVESGKARTAKKAGKLAFIGGPGKLIVKQGNVVVLERAGIISRVFSAGVTKLERMERIRNIFVLSTESNSEEIKHVLTKDGIPLTITLTMSFQLEQARETDKRLEEGKGTPGEIRSKIYDDGLYQVYEHIIRKAAVLSQATSLTQERVQKGNESIWYDIQETDWKQLISSVPEGELRDFIMSYRFDELFELEDSVPGDSPGARVDKRKISKIEAAILTKIRTSRALQGVLVRNVDIGKIEFPTGAERMLLDRWKADLEAQATVTRARANQQALKLKGQGEGEARAAFIREVLREMTSETVLKDNRVRAILTQLISRMVSVEDVESFVKALTYLERPSRGRREETWDNSQNGDQHWEELEN